MSFKNAIESSDIFDFQIAQDSRAARGAGWHLVQLPVKPCLRIHAPAARMCKQKLLNHPWWKVEPEHNKNIENNFGVYICWLQKKCWRTWNIIVPACSVHIYIYIATCLAPISLTKAGDTGEVIFRPCMQVKLNMFCPNQCQTIASYKFWNIEKMAIYICHGGPTT